MSHKPSPWASERLIYRAIETEDDPFLLAISSDAEAYVNAAPFIPVPQGKVSAAKFREWLGTALLAVIICLPPPVSNSTTAPDTATSQPVPIGMINLTADDPRFQHHRRSEIGVNLVRAYRSQGYGSEAIKWALRFGFMHCNLHRIAIAGFEYNPGALKLYERLGFKLESRKRDFLWSNGKYWDMVELSMLEDEWREQYAKE